MTYSKEQIAFSAAHHSLLRYARLMFPDYKVSRHIKLIAEALERVERGECKRLMISMPPRHGKQVSDDTPVLTTHGWKAHGELSIGDSVFTPNGTPTKIIAVSRPTQQDREVVFTDGTSVKCHKNHEWTIYDRSSRRYKTLETNCIERRMLWNGKRNTRGGRATLQLPQCAAIDMPPKELPIDPYVLGVWLGDGRSSSADIYWSAKDRCVAVEVERRNKFTRKWVHNITGVEYGYIDKLRPKLTKLGLIRNKRIPETYFTASRQQRLELLAGIIDTDGSLEQHSQRVRIVTISPVLAGDIECLIRTMGWRANRYTQQPSLSTSGIQGRRETHCVSFTPDSAIPTIIPRKKVTGSKNKKRAVGIAYVNKTTPCTGRCVQIEDEQGLYLVGKELIPTHNSQLVSEFFPAWYLGRNPDKYIITATYSQDLANDFGRKVRNQMLDQYHQAAFPDCRIVDDSKAKNKFNTTSKGVYYAVGVGASVTGRGAHLCLPVGTKVSTSAGYTDIAMLVPGDKVISYNEATGHAEEQTVEAIKNREADGIYRITTTAGRVVEATGNHPFYTSRGYIAADSLAPGDTLLCCVRSSVYQASIRGRKKHQKRPQRQLLLQAMFGITPRNKKRKTMRYLRKTSGKGLLQKREILQGMQTEAQWEKARPSCGANKVPNLQYRILSSMERQKPRTVCQVLQQEMRRNRALQTHVERRKPEMEERSDATTETTPFSQSFQGNAAVNTEKRRSQMRSMRRRKTASRTPHRQLAHEQRGKQPSNIVREMPFAMARGERFKTVADTVAMAERTHKTTRVYDIQVSSNHNFFANEICVHNCIIDDPLKGRKEAESEVQRQGLKDWYTSVAYTRLMPGGAIVIIQTRWHEDDLIGWCEREHSHEGWEVLNLPAIDEHNQPLWPEQYSLDTLLNIKRTIGSRDWEALYQQRPAASEGEIFKREWWKSYTQAPKLKWIMQSWDTAFKKGAENDYSVCTTWGVCDTGYYLLDSWKGKVEFPELKRTAKNLAAKWNPRAILIEDKASGQSLIQELRTNTKLNIISVPVDSDKQTRAYAVTPFIEAGNVYLPDGTEWVQDFIDECAVFPNGVHDDAVDSMTMFLNYIRRRGEAAFSDYAEVAKTAAKPQHVWRQQGNLPIYQCDQCGVAVRIKDGETAQEAAEKAGFASCKT